MANDPFGETAASNTPGKPERPLQDALDAQRDMDRIESTAREVGPTLDAIRERRIPVNPMPFNEMAGYFGAAGTIMNRLQNRGIDYIAREDLDREVREVWWTNGNEFVWQVVEIIVKYFDARPDQSDWDAAVDLRKRLLAEGFGGENFSRMLDLSPSPEAADLCRRVWFNNAR